VIQAAHYCQPFAYFKPAAMQPTRQKRQWHAQRQSRLGSSTDHGDTERRSPGSYLRHDNQDHGACPPRSASRLQQQHHANSARTPSWRDRVKLQESRAQGGARWIGSEAEEHSQRRQPPVRRWRSPEPPSRLRGSELDSSSVSRAWAQRHQEPHAPLRAPRPLNVSRLRGGHAPGPFVRKRWDSEVSTKYARSTRRQWVPNASHDDDDNCDDDGDENCDDDDDDDDENSDEQSNFTLEYRYSPPVRSFERWKDVRAEDRLQQTEGSRRLSHDDLVDFLGNQVPSWPAHRQLSRRVEMPARRWSQSAICSQDLQSEPHQEHAKQLLTTNSVNVQPYPMRPTRREMVETGNSVTLTVRQPLHTFEAGQAPCPMDKHDEQVDNGDDNRSEGDVHSTSKRRRSARGKRKATLTHDEAIVDCGSERGEQLVFIKPKVSGCESGIVKQRKHGTRKRYRKLCQYPDGCGKSAQGSTMFCIAHGGGGRCQYPDGCNKSAQGSTTFCKAHGGGKRCQYPQGCDKSAQGSTMFCKAHGGGKQCQYPEGCGKSAIGRTLFCKAHGGGKRCQYPEGCGKSALARTLFCIAHGGGKRCQYPEGCRQGATGRTLFCKSHGGGKRCQYPEGCVKSAQGSTMFCIAHGGGKRCQYPEGCDKSALGRTLLCRVHGGGKRCQYSEGCSKGAEGSTMFCKAHGGGKRCQYPEGCGKSAIGRTLFCVAHGGGKRCQYPDGCDKSAAGSTMFCRAHGGGRRCDHESGCRKHAIRGGLCKSHGADS
jgi:hypothetical protein